MAPIHGLGLGVAVPVALEAATPGARSPGAWWGSPAAGPKAAISAGGMCGFGWRGYTGKKVSLAVEPFACFCHLLT